MVDWMTAMYAGFPASLVNDAWLLTTFTLTGIVFYLMFEPGRRLSLVAALRHVFKRELFAHPSSRVDMLHFFLAMGFWTPLVNTALTAFLIIDVQHLLTGWFGPRAQLMQAEWLIIASQFLVVFVSRDFGTYVGHILLHKVPFLWSIHRTHHSAEVLTFFTSTRAHPLEYLHAQGFIAIFGALGGGLFVYLTGTSLHATPVMILAGTVVFFSLFGLAQHSHLPISFGKLDYILLTPVLHQLHHSAELRHRDKNLGGQLSVFDWIFGTLYLPQGREQYRWGLNDEELGANNPHKRLRDFYFEPASHAWRLLTKRGA